MDARTFKVRNGNKKAEAKKVLLWMFLMVLAVLIVLLIVYMTYHRYIPSFLEWFKTEDDIVVEAVETEYKIDQKVLDEFAELEKTISGALSNGEAVEIMLDIEKIESKLKDENNKQYNLAFEGQKIKLRDQGIEGRLSDQTVMEFAITTDKGIWVKADFNKIDNNNLPTQVQITNYDYDEDDKCFNFLKELNVFETNEELSAEIESTFPDLVNCESQINNNKYYDEITKFLVNEDNCYYELNFAKRTISDLRRNILYDAKENKLLITDKDGKTDKSHDIDFGNLNEEEDMIILNNEEFSNNIITIEKKNGPDGPATLNIYSPDNERYKSLNSKMDYISAQFSCDSYNKAMKDIETFNNCLISEDMKNTVIAYVRFTHNPSFYKDKNFVEFNTLLDTTTTNTLKIDFYEDIMLFDPTTEVFPDEIKNVQEMYFSERIFDNVKQCWRNDDNSLKAYSSAPNTIGFKEIRSEDGAYSHLTIIPTSLCEYQEPLEELLNFITGNDETETAVTEMRFKNKLSLILEDYAELYGEDYFKGYENEFLSKDIKLKLDDEKQLETKYKSNPSTFFQNIRQVSLLYQVNEECVETPINDILLSEGSIKDKYDISCPLGIDCKGALNFDEFKIKKIKQGADTKLVIAFEDSYDCFEKHDTVPYIDVLMYSTLKLYKDYFIEYDSDTNTVRDSFGNDVINYKIEFKYYDFVKMSKFEKINEETYAFSKLIRTNTLTPSEIYINLVKTDSNKETLNFYPGDSMIIEVNKIGEHPEIVFKHVYAEMRGSNLLSLKKIELRKPDNDKLYINLIE